MGVNRIGPAFLGVDGIGQIFSGSGKDWSKFLSEQKGLAKISARMDEKSNFDKGMGLVKVFAGVIKDGQIFSRCDQTVQNLCKSGQDRVHFI